MHKMLTLLAGIAVLATGCVRREPIRSSASLTVLDAQAVMPAPTRADLIAPDRQSLIGPLDTINVDVFGVSEFTRDVQVDASGRIAMPLIGTVDAGGRTAGAAPSPPTARAPLRGPARP